MWPRHRRNFGGDFWRPNVCYRGGFGNDGGGGRGGGGSGGGGGHTGGGNSGGGNSGGGNGNGNGGNNDTRGYSGQNTRDSVFGGGRGDVAGKPGNPTGQGGNAYGAAEARKARELAEAKKATLDAKSFGEKLAAAGKGLAGVTIGGILGPLGVAGKTVGETLGVIGIDTGLAEVYDNAVIGIDSWAKDTLGIDTIGAAYVNTHAVANVQSRAFNFTGLHGVQWGDISKAQEFGILTPAQAVQARAEKIGSLANPFGFADGFADDYAAANAAFGNTAIAGDSALNAHGGSVMFNSQGRINWNRTSRGGSGTGSNSWLNLNNISSTISGIADLAGNVINIHDRFNRNKQERQNPTAPAPATPNAPTPNQEAGGGNVGGAVYNLIPETVRRQFQAEAERDYLQSRVNMLTTGAQNNAMWIGVAAAGLLGAFLLLRRRR